jgi:xylulokinase
MKINLLAMSKVTGNYPKRMTVYGGGAKGNAWRQIMADVLCVDVLRIEPLDEAASIGAALLGGIGSGIFSDYGAGNNFLHIADAVSPRIENVRFYELMQPIFDDAYQGLVHVFSKLSKLQRYPGAADGR